MAPLTVAQMKKLKEKKVAKVGGLVPSTESPAQMATPTVDCEEEGSSTQAGLVRSKRPRSEGLECGADGFVAPPPHPLAKEELWRSCFQPVTGDGPVKTIWDRRFDFPELIDTFLMVELDGERVKAAGLRGSCRAMEAYGCWLTSIARSVDNQFGHLEDAQKKDEEELKLSK